MRNTGLVLATGSGKLLYHSFKTDQTHELFRFSGSRLMGITREADGKDLYVANHTEIYRMNFNNKKFHRIFEAPTQKHFHHMKIRDKKIFITATATNSIIVYDLKTKKVRDIKVTRNKAGKNHINSIFIQDGLYYITLNKAVAGQTGLSSIVVMDSNFNKIDEFIYGWQSHGFCIIDDTKYCLCGYWKEQGDINQPKYGGLMVDGKIEYVFEEGEFFKDISAGANHIYITGGQTSARDGRKHSDGIVYKFDYSLKPLKKLVIKDCGDVGGCLLDSFDLTS